MYRAAIMLLSLFAAGAVAGEYTNFVGMRFVDVAAGKFIMGSCTASKGMPNGSLECKSGVQDNNAGPDELPQHLVHIKYGFQMAAHEVTLGQYRKFVQATGSEGLQDKGFAKFNVHGEDAPVTYVTWNDAQAYIRWLNMNKPKEDAGVYRLPSEAEWEYAARAGSSSIYPWGNEVGKGNASCKKCGSDWDGQRPSPVGSFKPNQFGLYDMVGNVWEWLEDCGHNNYDGAPSDGSAWVTQCTDAKGVDNGRVVRGGSWDSDPIHLRTAYRNSYPHYKTNDVIGFRVVRAAP